MPKAKMVLHHDDPPCAVRLNKKGRCPECKLIPDMQSVALYPYCPKCDMPLKNLQCPKCKQTFQKPS